MREHETIQEPLTVDFEGLKKMLSCGRRSAEKVAAAAEATIRVGSTRKLYSVQKVKEYIEKTAG